MAPRKETPQENAARLSAAGAALKDKADYHGVLASMRAGNQVVQAIKSHLQLRGMWDPEATNENKNNGAEAQGRDAGATGV